MLSESTTSSEDYTNQEALSMAYVVEVVVFLMPHLYPPQVDRCEYRNECSYPCLAGVGGSGKPQKPDPSKPEKPKPPQQEPDRKGDKKSGRPEKPKTRKASSLLSFLFSLFF